MRAPLPFGVIEPIRHITFGVVVIKPAIVPQFLRLCPPMALRKATAGSECLSVKDGRRGAR